MKKKVILAAIISVMSLIFTVSAVLAVTGAISDIEISVSKFLNPDSAGNIIMRAFTEIGQVYTVIGVVALLLLLPHSAHLQFRWRIPPTDYDKRPVHTRELAFFFPETAARLTP